MSQLYVFIAIKTTVDLVVPLRNRNQDEFNRRVTNAFKGNTSVKTVCGDLKLRPNGNSIRGHLLCDGSLVQRAQFPELFLLIGTSESVGDGVSTFGLPNYLGVTLAVPATAPAQVVATSGTTIASTGVPITEPSSAGMTGGTSGGNILTGARSKDIITP